MLPYNRSPFPTLPQLPGTPPVGMPVWGGPQARTGIGPGGFQGFGNDLFHPGQSIFGQAPQPLGPQGPVASSPFGPTPISNDRTLATRPMMGQIAPEGPGSIGGPRTMAPSGMGGFGNDAFLPGGFAGGKPITGPSDRMPIGGDAAPSASITPPWFPAAAAPARATSPVSAVARGPLLPNNTAPNYRQGDGITLEPGQWHNPGYLSANGTMWTQNEPGVQHQSPGYLQQGMAGTSGGMGVGGAPGYGGNGYNPMQAFVDAQNAANAANENRYNQINGGFTDWRKREQDLLNGLGDQQRKDTERYFGNQRGAALQSMIDRGLTNSTILDNQNTRLTSEQADAMGRLNESLTRERLNQEYGSLKDQLAFMEKKNENAPDPRLLAQLAQGAAAAGGGMGGGFVDMGDAQYGYGGGGYGGYGGGMPFPLMGPGYGYGAGLANGTGKFGGSTSSGNSVLDSLLRGSGGRATEPPLILRGIPSGAGRDPNTGTWGGPNPYGLTEDLGWPMFGAGRVPLNAGDFNFDPRRIYG